MARLYPLRQRPLTAVAARGTELLIPKRDSTAPGPAAQVTLAWAFERLGGEAVEGLRAVIESPPGASWLPRATLAPWEVAARTGNVARVIPLQSVVILGESLLLNIDDDAIAEGDQVAVTLLADVQIDGGTIPAQTWEVGTA